MVRSNIIRKHFRKKRIGVESFHGGIVRIFQVDESHFLPAENGSGQLMTFPLESGKSQGDTGEIFFRGNDDLEGFRFIGCGRKSDRTALFQTCGDACGGNLEIGGLFPDGAFGSVLQRKRSGMDIGRFFFFNGRKRKIVKMDRLPAVDPQCDAGVCAISRGEEGHFRRVPFSGSIFENREHIADHSAGFIQKGDTGRDFGFRFTGDHKESKTEFELGLYNIETGELEYWNKDQYTEDGKVVKAACALLLLTKPVVINGTRYMDGGLIDMIPVEPALKNGCDKVIFISTKEENYIRKPAPSWQLKLARMAYKKEPYIAEDLKVRHENYAKQWGIVKDMQSEGNALVLRPSMDMGISRYTTDQEKLNKWYDLGYQDTLNRIEEIKAFMSK